MADENRKLYHGDQRVGIYNATGVIAPSANYEAPNFDFPTLQVSTEDNYSLEIDEVVRWIQSHQGVR